MRLVAIALLLAVFWLTTGFTPPPQPAQQACIYDAEILAGDDAPSHLRGTPIGHIRVSSCSSPADLAARVAELEAQVRAQWAASRP
jgi:hypothetical protein